MEAVRNAVPGLKNRAIAGPHDYDQIPALVERSRQRIRNFYADFNSRLADVPFVAGDEFSVADITAVVTVDFATKAVDLAIANEHAALKRWHDSVSARARAASWAAAVTAFRSSRLLVPSQVAPKDTTIMMARIAI